MKRVLWGFIVALVFIYIALLVRREHMDPVVPPQPGGAALPSGPTSQNPESVPPATPACTSSFPSWWPSWLGGCPAPPAPSAPVNVSGGATEVTNPDGTKTVKGKPGNTAIIPAGSTYTVDEDGTIVTVGADGKRTTQVNPDGSSQAANPYYKDGSCAPYTYDPSKPIMDSEEGMCGWLPTGGLSQIVRDFVCAQDSGCKEGQMKTNIPIMWGLLHVPWCMDKCKPGYNSDGLLVCWKQYQGYDCGEGSAPIKSTITSVTKGSNVVGPHVLDHCNDDEDMDAGLCYKKCPKGMHGVGPVCWVDSHSVGIGTLPG